MSLKMRLSAMTPEKRDYAINELVEHFQKSNQMPRLYELLIASPEWMEAKAFYTGDDAAYTADLDLASATIKDPLAGDQLLTLAKLRAARAGLNYRIRAWSPEELLALAALGQSDAARNQARLQANPVDRFDALLPFLEVLSFDAVKAREIRSELEQLALLASGYSEVLWSFVRLGTVYAQQGLSADVLRLAERITRLAPANAEQAQQNAGARRLLAEALAKHGHATPALQIAEAIKDEWTRIDTLVPVIIALVRHNATEQALALIEQMSKGYILPEGMVEICKALAEQGRIEAVRDIAHLKPNRASLLLASAAQVYAIHDQTTARELIEQAHESLNKAKEVLWSAAALAAAMQAVGDPRAEGYAARIQFLFEPIEHVMPEVDLDAYLYGGIEEDDDDLSKTQMNDNQNATPAHNLSTSPLDQVSDLLAQYNDRTDWFERLLALELLAEANLIAPELQIDAVLELHARLIQSHKYFREFPRLQHILSPLVRASVLIDLITVVHDFIKHDGDREKALIQIMTLGTEHCSAAERIAILREVAASERVAALPQAIQEIALTILSLDDIETGLAIIKMIDHEDARTRGLFRAALLLAQRQSPAAAVVFAEARQAAQQRQSDDTQRAIFQLYPHIAALVARYKSFERAQKLLQQLDPDSYEYLETVKAICSELVAQHHHDHAGTFLREHFPYSQIEAAIFAQFGPHHKSTQTRNGLYKQLALDLAHQGAIESALHIVETEITNDRWSFEQKHARRTIADLLAQKGDIDKAFTIIKQHNASLVDLIVFMIRWQATPDQALLITQRVIAGKLPAKEIGVAFGEHGFAVPAMQIAQHLATKRGAVAQDDNAEDGGIIDIARAVAKGGNGTLALQIAELPQRGYDKRIAYRDIAIELARRGAIDDALRAVNKITYDPEQAELAWSALAVARAMQGETESVRTILTEQISNRQLREQTALRVATAYGTNGRFIQAFDNLPLSQPDVLIQQIAAWSEIIEQLFPGQMLCLLDAVVETLAWFHPGYQKVGVFGVDT